MTKSLSLKMIFMIGLLLGAPVMAQDAPEVNASEVPEDAEVFVLDNPYKQKIEDQAKILAESFSEQEVKNFTLVNQGFGFVRSIEVARETIEGAVKKCSDKNPDMKASMNGTFDEWKDKVNPVLKEQERNLGIYVGKDYFENPKELEKYFDLLDKAARHADNNIDKQIVSSPEACERLRESMAETSSVIVKHLESVEWPSQTLDEARASEEE